LSVSDKKSGVGAFFTGKNGNNDQQQKVAAYDA